MTGVETKVAHMLAAMREGVFQGAPAQEVDDAGEQEPRIHGAVLPVLQVAHLETPVPRIQPPATHQPPLIMQHPAMSLALMP